MSATLRRFLVRLTCAAACALGLAAPACAQAPATVHILTSWFAQPDQGGYWEAQQKDLGKADGLKIIVDQGGPKIQTIPQVLAGQADFGIAPADDLLLARLRGVPVVAVFAHLDVMPYTLVYHSDPAVKSVADLQGRPFAVALGAAYWEWIKKQYKLAPGREMPVTGDLTLFRNDPRMVQQGLSIYLPPRMAAASIEVSQFTVAALGYRPYYVLFTTEDMVRNRPQIVRQTVAAVRKGWIDFMQDPQTIKPYLLKLNQQISSPIYDSAVQDMAASLVPKDPASIGCMTAARWQELAAQLESVRFLPANFDPKLAYDLSFLQGC